MRCYKISYSSFQDAKQDARLMCRSRKKKHRNFTKNTTPYLCNRCNNYHLTSMPTADRKRLKKKIKEEERRLTIVKKIRKSKSLEKILELQESWMLLMLKGNNWILECDILGRTHYVKQITSK